MPKFLSSINKTYHHSKNREWNSNLPLYRCISSSILLLKPWELFLEWNYCRNVRIPINHVFIQKLNWSEGTVELNQFSFIIDAYESDSSIQIRVKISQQGSGWILVEFLVHVVRRLYHVQIIKLRFKKLTY